MAKCLKCGEADPTKFYWRDKSKTKLRSHICRRCDNARVLKLGQEQRRKAVNFLGGVCISCGFDKWIASLDIHHRDTSKKDPAFNTMRYWAWERVEKELKKCVLLCKNCHAAFHSGELKL